MTDVDGRVGWLVADDEGRGVGMFVCRGLNPEPDALLFVLGTERLLEVLA